MTDEISAVSLKRRRSETAGQTIRVVINSGWGATAAKAVVQQIEVEMHY